jgi:Protein of unknown function (DUF3037)
MKKYQYQILRYVHDQFTGEFVNLGVVLYSPEDLFLEASVSPRYSRINALFPNANGKFITKLIKQFEVAVKHVSSELNTLFQPSENLLAITKSILPQDDSALMLSEVKYAIDIDLECALADLFNELVNKYFDSQNKQSLNDDEVWKEKYKTYFDKYGVSERLTTHEVITKNDAFSFDKSWKNGAWHCYQPISFDLQNMDTIKSKVYKWSGILREIDRADEQINITFLASMSKQFGSINKFIENSLNQDTEYIKVEVVDDTKAEYVAKKIGHQIKQHDDELLSNN